MGPLESPKQFQAVPPVREVFETVLLVEDDILVRDLLAEILRTNGYKVLLASSGTEALKIAETLKTPIHVMLTDMVMPGMSGPELSKQMSSIRPGIRIILMSGYSWPQMDNEDLSGQKSLFLAKPFSPFDLKRKLEQALAKN